VYIETGRHTKKETELTIKIPSKAQLVFNKKEIKVAKWCTPKKIFKKKSNLLHTWYVITVREYLQSLSIVRN
jgi:hypothetical protein